MNTPSWSAALLSLCLTACASNHHAARADLCAPPRPLALGPRVSSFCGLHAGRYYWDGRACAAVDAAPCLCGVRHDCAPYYDDLTACEVAHARCR